MIDVIIPTLWRQNPEEFCWLLEDLQEQPLINKIIIVVNDGCERPLEEKRTFFPEDLQKIEAINLGGLNLGVNESWNTAVRFAYSPIVWLLNDDLYLIDDPMRGVNLASALGQIVYLFSNEYAWKGWHKVGLIGTNVRQRIERDSPFFMDVTDNDWCYGFGCSMFVSGSFLRNHPIPSSFRIMCGDSYLCLLVRSLGMRVLQLEGLEFDGKMSTTSSSPEFAEIIEEDIKNFYMWREGMGL